MNYEDRVTVLDKEQTVSELVGYCDIHADTERALFHKEMIAKMIELAGNPVNYSSSHDLLADIRKDAGLGNFYSMHESMKELVSLVRQRADAGSGLERMTR